MELLLSHDDLYRLREFADLLDDAADEIERLSGTKMRTVRTIAQIAREIKPDCRGKLPPIKVGRGNACKAK